MVTFNQKSSARDPNDPQIQQLNPTNQTPIFRAMGNPEEKIMDELSSKILCIFAMFCPEFRVRLQLQLGFMNELIRKPLRKHSLLLVWVKARNDHLRGPRTCLNKMQAFGWETCQLQDESQLTCFFMEGFGSSSARAPKRLGRISRIFIRDKLGWTWSRRERFSLARNTANG